MYLFHIEVILNGKVINSTNFKWDIGLNFSANKNKINKLLGYDNDGDGKEDDLISSGLFIGESIGSIYNYPIEGMWQIADRENLPAGFHVGTYKLKDTNGDGEYTPDDRALIGRTEPAYRFGIQNTVKYKNLALRFFIKSVQGGKDGYLSGMGYNREQSTFEFNMLDNIDYWTPSNPNGLFIVPGVSNPLPVTRFFDRSFVRLQDISLSYDFNKEAGWMKAIGVKGCNLYVSGKNLVTISDWPGWDPETANKGDKPVMKSVTAGLEISF